MKQTSSQRSVWGAFVMLTMIACATATAAPRTEQLQEPTSAPRPVTDAVEKAPPRGRLPAYYAKVVSDQQRQQIYAIQARYQERIEELTKELATLTDKRNEEVANVLSDEQRAEIAKLKGARKSNRSSGDEPPPAEETP